MPYRSEESTRPLHTPLVQGASRHAPSHVASPDPYNAGSQRAASPYGGGRPGHDAHSGGEARGYGSHASRIAAPAEHQRENPYGARAARVSSAAGDHADRLERARVARSSRRRRTALAVVLGIIGVVAVVLGVSSLRGRTQPAAPAAPAGSAEVVVPDEPAPTEAELRTEEVRARAAANCTREQPSALTDPADYAALGKQTLEAIGAACASWEGFENADAFSLDARTSYDGDVAPYLLAVNRAANVVTVYALDADNRYTVPYQAMICSTGTYTPIGFYATDEKYGWLPLYQEVFGQYATRIVRDILFHSVPFYNPHKDDLEYAEYNKLGTAASLGCVRLQVCDVKWIYDNCPLGTPVLIYDDADNPGPMGRPGTIATNETDTDTTSATYRGFDPTDPDAANPWDDAYRSGTAIRSDAAQAEWDAAQADGRWDATINPTDLLGWSTDASTRE